MAKTVHKAALETHDSDEALLTEVRQILDQEKARRAFRYPTLAVWLDFHDRIERLERDSHYHTDMEDR